MSNHIFGIPTTLQLEGAEKQLDEFKEFILRALRRGSKVTANIKNLLADKDKPNDQGLFLGFICEIIIEY